MDEIIEIDGIQYSYNSELDEYIQVINNNNLIKQTKQTKQIEQIKPIEPIETNNYWYPEVPDIDAWEVYLSRQLDEEEKEIISNVFEEEDTNKQIQKIKSNISGSDCFIPKLTKSNGNCLFESLSILGLGENNLGIEGPEMLRNNIASILLYMRNCYDFFPNVSQTPEEIFDNSNEVDLIKNSKTNAVYMYNYDMMICDLKTKYKWKRLPTELILMAISRIYQVKILIHHNNSQYINEINVWAGKNPNESYDNSHGKSHDNSIETIRLALVNEEHYVPIMQIPNELKNDFDTIQAIGKINLKYSDAFEQYHKWAVIMSKSIYDSYTYLHSSIDTKLDNKLDNKKEETIGITGIPVIPVIPECNRWKVESSDITESMDLDNFDFI